MFGNVSTHAARIFVSKSDIIHSALIVEMGDQGHPSQVWRNHHIWVPRGKFKFKCHVISNVISNVISFFTFSYPKQTGTKQFSLYSALNMKVWYHRPGVIRKVLSANTVRVRDIIFKLSSLENRRTRRPSLCIISPFTMLSSFPRDSLNQSKVVSSSACVKGCCLRIHCGLNSVIAWYVG
jgi:hypothetical protein